MGSKGGLLDPRLHSTPKGDLQTTPAPLAGTPWPDAFSHRARSAVAAVCLGRRRPADQNAFRRFDPSLAAQAGSTALVVHVRCLAPHPVARCEPWSASSRAGGSPRAISRGHEPSRDGHVTPRERCVSPTSATDSLHEHPTDCSIPGRASCHAPSCDVPRSVRVDSPWVDGWGSPPIVIPGGRRAGSSSGRLSDESTRWSFAWRRTSSFGLRHDHHASRSTPRGAAVRVWSGARSWWSPDRRLLRAAPPGRGLFDRAPSSWRSLWRPLSHPAADPASLPHPHRLGPPEPALLTSRQRRRRSPAQDVFHRRVLPPPSTPDACASARGITRSPPPDSLLACSWLSPPRTGFQRRFTHGAHTRERASQRARPGALRPGPSAARRLLQPQQPASTTARPPEPRLVVQGSESLHTARAAPSRRTVRGRSPTLRHRRHRSRFHGSGEAGGLRCRLRPASRAPSRASKDRGYPNPIRSDTSRRETVAPPVGDSGAARGRSRQGETPATIPPHEPHPREG